MKDVHGKVAVVTGAASGIGRGMAEAFCAAGMKVVLSDVEEPALEATASALRAAGNDVHAVRTDVSKLEQVEHLARETVRKYGAVHVLCNNAGIGLKGGVASWEATIDDWTWILKVNLMGVMYGQRAFLPIMLQQDCEAHIVNTASLAGLVAGADTLYGVTKAAVVRLTEGTFLELQNRQAKVGMSVLCPGFVDTHIMQADRNRPAELSDTITAADTPFSTVFREWFAQQLKEGLSPRAVGDQVLAAILENRFYVLTHPDWNYNITDRMQRIISGERPSTARPPNIESLTKQLEALLPRKA